METTSRDERRRTMRGAHPSSTAPAQDAGILVTAMLARRRTLERAAKELERLLAQHRVEARKDGARA